MHNSRKYYAYFKQKFFITDVGWIFSQAKVWMKFYIVTSSKATYKYTKLPWTIQDGSNQSNLFLSVFSNIYTEPT